MAFVSSSGSATQATNVYSTPAAPPAPHPARKPVAVNRKMGGLRHSAAQATAALKNAKPDRIVTKQTLCNQIRRHAKSVERLAFGQHDASLLTPQLGSLCFSLAESGRAVLSASHGKYTMKAISDLVKGFKTLTATYLKAGDFETVASICMNYSEELDRLSGIERPPMRQAAAA